jgi:hypothetical protein
MIKKIPESYETQARMIEKIRTIKKTMEQLSLK